MEWNKNMLDLGFQLIKNIKSLPNFSPKIFFLLSEVNTKTNKIHINKITPAPKVRSY